MRNEEPKAAATAEGEFRCGGGGDGGGADDSVVMALREELASKDEELAAERKRLASKDEELARALAELSMLRGPMINPITAPFPDSNDEV